MPRLSNHTEKHDFLEKMENRILPSLSEEKIIMGDHAYIDFQGYATYITSEIDPESSVRYQQVVTFDKQIPVFYCRLYHFNDSIYVTNHTLSALERKQQVSGYYYQNHLYKAKDFIIPATDFTLKLIYPYLNKDKNVGLMSAISNTDYGKDYWIRLGEKALDLGHSLSWVRLEGEKVRLSELKKGDLIKHQSQIWTTGKERVIIGRKDEG